VAAGDVVLLENCRVNKGEKKNSDELARKIATLADVYVNDAFGTAHRAEATTHGAAKFAPVACAGPLLAAEIEALGRALGNPKRPLAAIVAGSKVSTKLTLLNNLAQKVDRLIVGGGIANTFLLAEGFPIGKSLAEPDLVPECKKVLATLAAKGATLPLPIDVVVAKEFSATAPGTVRRADDVHPDEMILDIGPQSALSCHTCCAMPARSSGTARWACSSLMPLPTAHTSWRWRSPRPPPMVRSRSPGEATRWLQSPSTASRTASVTSRPVAEPSLSFSRENAAGHRSAAIAGCGLTRQRKGIALSRFAVAGIDHVHIYVRDRAAAARWYGAVLGLRRDRRFAAWRAKSVAH